MDAALEELGVTQSMLSEQSAKVAGSHAAVPEACAELPTFFGRWGPCFMVPSRDNDARNARHWGHDRTCSPISTPAISMLRSATTLASCARLGQPVTAIPPILQLLGQSFSLDCSTKT
jgi:hypothetical protein